MQHYSIMVERSGADVIADTLSAWGCQFVFHVPGEGILEIIEAIYQRQPSIRLITTRHEAGMAVMADAMGRLNGRPAVCLAPRSPGALNTMLAMHTAYMDSVPLIMIIGQASLAFKDREAFHDDAFHKCFAPVSKAVLEVDDPQRLPEYLSRAYHTATSGRLGPVVLVVPEEILHAQLTLTDTQLTKPVEIAPQPTDMVSMAKLLQNASKPIVLMGGSGWSEQARLQFRKFAETHHLPVVTAFRRRDLFDNSHPCFVGELGIGINQELAGRITEADVVLAVNVRLGEINTIGQGAFQGYTLLKVPIPEQKLIHVHPQLSHLNRVYQAELAINATPIAFCQALDELSLMAPTWSQWTAEVKAIYERYTSSGNCRGAIDLKAVFQWLRQRLPKDAILTVGAGAYALWPQRYFTHTQFGTQLGPKTGAMGYGLPAAIAASLNAPDKLVVAVAGDGCFLMQGEELATAVHYRTPVIVLILNNHCYGAIRMNQERLYGNPVGTDLSSPNFAAYAESFGAFGKRITSTKEFEPAFEEAVTAKKPAVIELLVDGCSMKPQAD